MKRRAWVTETAGGRWGRAALAAALVVAMGWAGGAWPAAARAAAPPVASADREGPAGAATPAPGAAAFNESPPALGPTSVSASSGASPRPPASAEAAAPAPPSGAAKRPDLARLAEEVAREVEALRGWKFKRPVARRMAGPADVRAYLERQIAEQVPPEKVRRIQAFLRLVGLLPPDCDLKRTFLDLLQEQVGGYYDHKTDALCLVDRGEPLPPLVARIMLAHELTHALDDQHADLDAFFEKMTGRSEDLDLVAAAVTEGSATTLMTRYMARAMLSAALEDAQGLQAYTEREARRSRRLLEAPRYFAALLGAYVCGMEFLARGDPATALAKGVGENFLAAVKNPPRSTEQILHPAKYWDPARRDEPVVVDDAAVARLLETGGRWVVHTDTVGEMLCAVLTNPPGVRRSLFGMSTAAAWTNRGAEGWGGDRFYLVASGPDRASAARDLKEPRGLWITLWDTPRDRDEFVETYTRRPPTVVRVVAPMGNLGAVVLLGFPEAEARALARRLGEAPPPMTRGGRPWSPWSV